MSMRCPICNNSLKLVESAWDGRCRWDCEACDTVYYFPLEVSLLLRRKLQKQGEKLTQTHHLKTWPEFYGDIVRGDKTFDIRKDDRGFNVGDTLILEEFDPKKGQYTGNSQAFIVTYCLRKEPWVPKGYVAMGIRWQYKEA